MQWETQGTKDEMAQRVNLASKVLMGIRVRQEHRALTEWQDLLARPALQDRLVSLVRPRLPVS